MGAGRILAKACSEAKKIPAQNPMPRRVDTVETRQAPRGRAGPVFFKTIHGERHEISGS
jgi:hypothetical protein